MHNRLLFRGLKCTGPLKNVSSFSLRLSPITFSSLYIDDKNKLMNTDIIISLNMFNDGHYENKDAYYNIIYESK